MTIDLRFWYRISSVFLFFTGLLFADDIDRSFSVGESYHYYIYAGPEKSRMEVRNTNHTEMKKAAKAVISVNGTQMVGATKCLSLEMSGEVLGWARVFNVSQKLTSLVEKDFSKSHRYSRHSTVLFASTFMNVDFDWTRSESRAVRTYRRLFRTGRKEYVNNLADGTLDPVAAFFAFRLLDLEVGKTYTMPLTDGKGIAANNIRPGVRSYIPAKFHVIRSELISVNGNRYDTLVVRPEIQGVRGLTRDVSEENLEIFVSRDRRQIPLKITAEIMIGGTPDRVRFVEARLDEIL